MSRSRRAALVALVVATGIGFAGWALLGNGDKRDTASGMSWRGLWPQDSREEAERAQLRAIRGDPRDSWQADDPDAEEVFLRYAREALGWHRPQPISIHIPEGRDWVREARVLRCAPGPNPGYPEIDCAPSEERAYLAANVTAECLVRRDPRGIWIVTDAKLTEITLPAPASKEDVRPFVTEFLDRRVRGSGAEEYASADDRREFRKGPGGLGPLYRSVGGFRYGGYELEFVDGPLWPFASFEVGVRLLPASGPGVHEETLFVGPGTDLSGEERPLLILGGRWGFNGP